MFNLPSQNYSIALEAIAKVPFNTLFAQAVLLGKAPGEVFVDSLILPNNFYVLHNYGMSLLYGDANNPTFEKALITRLQTLPRSKAEYLQATPKWSARIRDPKWKLWERLENSAPEEFMATAKKQRYLICKRLNLTLESAQFGHSFLPTSYLDGVVPTTTEIFNRQQGSVLAKYFWKDAADFKKNSYGISVMRGEDEASTAFASFIIGNQFELGIETKTEYRGQGLAQIACYKLCEQALSRGFQLHWACRDGNYGSRRLAEKLGFTLSAEHDYFCVA